MKKKIPYLGKDANGTPVLYVDGAPMLLLAGELHNSSYSSAAWMEREVWPYLRPFSLNTVIAPIAWENVEPVEGTYDFSLVGELLSMARREGVRVVLLWFGLWKNGESTYVPDFVKADTKRFFRAKKRYGEPIMTVSPFCREAVSADRKAFVELMRYLKENDGNDHTVIAVQVENEIGILGDERDFCEAANACYSAPVPDDAKAVFGMQTGDNWKACYGENAPENMMVYAYAKAVETIASAGKKVYPLPMYVNAWLEQHPDVPGAYPCGGPVAKQVKAWRALAPSIDFCSPDIYVKDFASVCRQYHTDENPLFIPEASRLPISATNVFYAFSEGCALCFSPFALEDADRVKDESPSEAALADFTTTKKAFTQNNGGAYVARSFAIVRGMLPMILKTRGTPACQGFLRRDPGDTGTILHLREYDLRIDYGGGQNAVTGAGGCVIETDDGVYISGTNATFIPIPKKGSDTRLTVLSLEEGEWKDGEWVRGRILNGDERGLHWLGDMAENRKIKVYVEKI